jgi:hypothetical protein
LGCLFIIVLFFSTRAAILLWWLLDTSRWQSAFEMAWVPVLGFIFLPATTLVWVAVAPTGKVLGYGWVWLGLAFLGDVSSLLRGGWHMRNRAPKTV